MSLIQNARIASTMLGFEGHGMLTFSLGLQLGEWHQGFGGYAMDDSVFAAKAIRALLTTVGVEKWEDLRGKFVRVEHDSAGLNSKIVRIGNIVDDIWFDPSAVAKEDR